MQNTKYSASEVARNEAAIEWSKKWIPHLWFYEYGPSFKDRPEK